MRWYRGQSPTRHEHPTPASRPPNAQNNVQEEPPEPENPRPLRRRSSSPDPLPSLYQCDAGAQRLASVVDEAEDHAETQIGYEATPVFGDDDEEEDDDRESSAPPPRLDPTHRLSTSSYPNVGIDPHDGKWVPQHNWSSAHDLLYAKLCYSNLLFRSPRKSNYIISKGKKWYVDWTTGRMVRVLPPTYGEVDYFGPWQVVHTENMRI